MKKTKEYITFLIMLIITILIFIPFLHAHYSTDSYSVENAGYKVYITSNSLHDGRIIMAGILYLAELLKIPMNVFIIVLTYLALLTGCFNVLILKKHIIDKMKIERIFPQILITIICYFTIFNFMYIENMVFIECFVMALSILFYLLAAKILINKSNYYIIKTLLMVFLGITCYQGTISMYLISILVFSLIEDKKYSEIIKHYIIGGMILVIAMLIQMGINQISQNILGTNSEQIRNVAMNTRVLLKNLKELLIVTGFVYPRYLYIIFCNFILLCIIIKILKEKLNKKIIVNSLIIIIFSIIFAMTISCISTRGLWGARIRYSMGTTIGFLIIYISCKTDIIKNLQNKLNAFILLIFMVYAISIVTNYILIMNNTLRVNQRDKELAIEVSDYVKDYEIKNNVIVDKLTVIRGGFDKEKAFFTGTMYKNSILSWSAMRTKWSIEAVLEKYSDKDYNLVELGENELKMYILNVDRTKEYICIGDTLYISYYKE